MTKEAKARINLTVGVDVPDLLTQLAGGERARGEYITRLVREAASKRPSVSPEVQMLRLEVEHLSLRMRVLEEKGPRIG